MSSSCPNGKLVDNTCSSQFAYNMSNHGPEEGSGFRSRFRVRPRPRAWTPPKQGRDQWHACSALQPQTSEPRCLDQPTGNIPQFASPVRFTCCVAACSDNKHWRARAPPSVAVEARGPATFVPFDNNNPNGVLDTGEQMAHPQMSLAGPVVAFDNVADLAAINLFCCLP